MMEESTLLTFNRSRRPGRDRLVAIYPREGTFLNDHPFIVLDAPWVSRDKRRAAAVFGRFLAERITPELAARQLPSRGARRPPARAGRRRARRGPVAAAPHPAAAAAAGARRSPGRLAARPQAGQRARRARHVGIDGRRRPARAREGRAGPLLHQVGPQDAVGLQTFSDDVRTVVPLAGSRQALPRVRAAVQRLAADGGTALFDATAVAFAEVRALRAEERINAVVLLSDGEDTDSSIEFQDLVRELAAQGDSASKVRLFTIAYGADAAGRASSSRRSRGRAAGAAMRARPSRSRPCTNRSRRSSEPWAPTRSPGCTSPRSACGSA